MRRFGFVLAAAALLGVVSTANAQLSMQMGNGWNATFSGNVNAFYIYNSTSDDLGGGDGVNTSKSNGIGTGLLPAFFVFDAKGKEGNTDLGVHFGFAPQVSSGNNVASFFGNQAAGAQIDMRQVYATVGGTWGTILFGKELGIFQRQNILQDITLFGVGPSSVGRGTALGRIGYGYLYTDFRPQFSYATPAGKPFSLTFGILDPTTVGAYEYADMPRFEAEFTYKSTFGTDKKNSFLLFASGAYGHAKVYASDDVAPDGDNPGISQTGFSGGAKIDVGGFAVTGSGFFASGMGTLFMGDAILGDPADGKVCIDCLDANGDAQDTYGWYAQAIYTFPSSKASLGASYGGNYVSDPADVGDFSDRTALVFQGTYFITKSTRVVAEYTNFRSNFEGVDGSVSTNQFALGMMLFY